MTIEKFYRLKPEVPGQLGCRTKIDSSVFPPCITHLHFVFDGWLGDELIECFPCYLVTENLLNCFLKAGLSGFEIDTAEIEYSVLFNELYPGRKMPPFYWLKINSNKLDDLFIDQSNLVVSGKGYAVIKAYSSLNNCEIVPF